MNEKTLKLLKDTRFVKEFALAKTDDEARNLFTKKEINLNDEEFSAVTEIISALIKKTKELKKQGISDKIFNKMAKEELSEKELELCVGGGFLRKVGYATGVLGTMLLGNYLGKKINVGTINIGHKNFPVNLGPSGYVLGACVGYLGVKYGYIELDEYYDSLEQRKKEEQKRKREQALLNAELEL